MLLWLETFQFLVLHFLEPRRKHNCCRSTTEFRTELPTPLSRLQLLPGHYARCSECLQPLLEAFLPCLRISAQSMLLNSLHIFPRHPGLWFPPQLHQSSFLGMFLQSKLLSLSTAKVMPEPRHWPPAQRSPLLLFPPL